MQSAPKSSLLQRAYPWFVTVVIIGISVSLAGATLWARREQADLAVSQADTASLRGQLVQAQGSLTAFSQAQADASATAQAQADATATAQAEANDPTVALQQALQLVFATYQDPSNANVQAVGNAFAPSALGFEDQEAQHLASTQTHLGGQSAFTMNVLHTTPTDNGAAVETAEHWEYDEVDASDTRVRCVAEDSQQTYAMQHAETGWIVESVSLESDTRTDC